MELYQGGLCEYQYFVDSLFEPSKCLCVSNFGAHFIPQEETLYMLFQFAVCPTPDLPKYAVIDNKPIEGTHAYQPREEIQISCEENYEYTGGTMKCIAPGWVNSSKGECRFTENCEFLLVAVGSLIWMYIFSFWIFSVLKAKDKCKTSSKTGET